MSRRGACLLVVQVAAAPVHAAVGVVRHELAMHRRRGPFQPGLFEPMVFAWFEDVGEEMLAFMRRNK
jgi:hypothetical protein